MRQSDIKRFAVLFSVLFLLHFVETETDEDREKSKYLPRKHLPNQSQQK